MKLEMKELSLDECERVAGGDGAAGGDPNGEAPRAGGPGMYGGGF